MLHKQQALLPVLLAAGIAAGQTFEVASVKPSKSASPRFTMTGGPGTSDPGRVGYSNIMLRRVMLPAYDVRNFQLTGPDWLDTLRYDIEAKVPAGATVDEFHAMMRHLLESRFRMTLHRESRETAVYALVPAKGGVKLRSNAQAGESSPNEIATVQSQEGRDGFPVVALPPGALVIETKNGAARISAKDVPLVRLADMLTGRVGRPVIDTTGLTGVYTFNLYFTPDGPDAANSTEPGIFTAVQEQLGLRLEARRAPVEYLVVDRAEKVPVEN